MTKVKKAMPETMFAPETGETLTRDVRPFEVVYKSERRTVDLPGYYPLGGGESVHVGEDLKAASEALRAIKEKLDGIPTPATIRRVRAKLKLSQRQAGALLKVGEDAFNKYERGLITPSGPTIQLLKVLDRHPEIAKELA